MKSLKSFEQFLNESKIEYFTNIKSDDELNDTTLNKWESLSASDKAYLTKASEKISDLDPDTKAGHDYTQRVMKKMKTDAETTQGLLYLASK